MKTKRKLKAAYLLTKARPDNARNIRLIRAVGPREPSAKAVARHIHPRRIRALGGTRG